MRVTDILERLSAADGFAKEDSGIGASSGDVSASSPQSLLPELSPSGSSSSSNGDSFRSRSPQQQQQSNSFSSLPLSPAGGNKENVAPSPSSSSSAGPPPPPKRRYAPHYQSLIISVVHRVRLFIYASDDPSSCLRWCKWVESSCLSSEAVCMHYSAGESLHHCVSRPTLLKVKAACIS